MGLFSSFFRKSEEDEALEDALKKLNRILEDEDFQLELADPALQSAIKQGVSVDQLPNGNGQFGRHWDNPIPVNGPIGELAYLSRLEFLGQRFLFHRLGSMNKVDVFEAVTFENNDWRFFFLDFYHPRRSRLTPDNHDFTKEVPQFTGFTAKCPDFPYDFPKAKAAKSVIGLSIAYIPLSLIMPQLERRSFNPPPLHIEMRTQLSQLLSSQAPSAY
jgi:hypothetical protein